MFCMKHGNKDALSSSSFFLCFLPFHVTCRASERWHGALIALGYSPRGLSVASVRRPTVIIPTSLLPVYVIFASPVLFAGRLCCSPVRWRSCHGCESPRLPQVHGVTHSWTPLYKITRRKETPKTHTKDSIFASLFINACDFRAH